MKKLTSEILKKMVLEEKSKLENKDMPKTVENSWSGGDNLEKQIVWAKALKLEETRLLKRIKRVSKVRSKIRKNIKNITKEI